MIHMKAIPLLFTFAAALPGIHSSSNAKTLLSGRDGDPETQPFQAGVFYVDPDNSVSQVSANMDVTSLTYTPGGPSTQSVSFWVGIWGGQCGFDSGLLQTGFTGQITSDGTQQFYAWYEWYPEPAYQFDGITINIGDQISMEVYASSPTTGTATVNNLSNGQSASIDLTGPQLCQSNAEWVAEDFAFGDGIADEGLADFGTIVMTDAIATCDKGTSDASQGHSVYMNENGNQRAVGSADGATVTIQYTG